MCFVLVNVAIFSQILFSIQPTASEKSLAVDMLAPSKNTTTSVTGSLELHTQTKAKYNKEMRDELLGKTSGMFLQKFYSI